jgi:hypothetical protein
MKFCELTYFDNSPMAEWGEGVLLDDIECPVNEGHQRRGARKGNLVILFPSKIGDVVWTWYSDMLINDRVKHLFEKAGFTGFELKPVSIGGIVKNQRKNKLIEAKDNIGIFWEMVITGWGGLAHPESGIQFLETQSCKHCGYLVYSHFKDTANMIDITQWDGSDFFMIWPLPKFIFVTERVADCIRKHKLKDCNLIPLEKIPLKDKDLFKTLSPGRLSYYMPGERAHLLGDSLGIF